MDNTLLERFKSGLESLMNSYRSAVGASDLGRDRSVAYGNVRHQTWSSENSTSFGITFETPGGSTNQVHVVFEHAAQQFVAPTLDGTGEVRFREPSAALQHVKKICESIPDYRYQKLRAFVDDWRRDGRSRMEIWFELNRLLQEQLRGGRITHDELARVSRYVVESFSREPVRERSA